MQPRAVLRVLAVVWALVLVGWAVARAQGWVGDVDVSATLPTSGATQATAPAPDPAAQAPAPDPTGQAPAPPTEPPPALLPATKSGDLLPLMPATKSGLPPRPPPEPAPAQQQQ
jgi:hypothetical protein